jgi:hypothetical protein
MNQAVRRLVAFALLGWSSVALAGEVIPIVTWIPAEGTEMSSETIELLARRHLRSGLVVESERVELVDHLEDEVHGAALRVAIDGIRVTTARGSEATVNLNLFFDSDGDRLLLAATNPREVWHQPGQRRAEPQELMEDRGWSIEPLRDDERVEAAIEEVLSVVWSYFGVRTDNVGQLVIRPRRIHREYPKEEVGGEWVSVQRAAEPGWFVQGEGGRIPNSMGFVTGSLIV